MINDQKIYKMESQYSRSKKISAKSSMAKCVAFQ